MRWLTARRPPCPGASPAEGCWWSRHFPAQTAKGTRRIQAAADGRNPKPTALDVSTRRGSASDFFLDGFCLPFREPVSDVAVGQQILGLGRIVFQLLA